MSGTMIDLGTRMAATSMTFSPFDATHALAPVGFMLAAIVVASIVAIGAANAKRLGAFIATRWATPLRAAVLDVGALLASCAWMIAEHPAYPRRPKPESASRQ